MTKSQHGSEADKLWVAIKRDYFVAVETVAGVRPDEGAIRWTRLLKNWRALCAVDLAVAAQLAHGLREVSLVFDADYRGPADRHLQQLDEMFETPDRGRAAINVEDGAISTMHELAEGALQRRIDEDPGHLCSRCRARQANRCPGRRTAEAVGSLRFIWAD